jgi:hypothetical protein
MARATTCFLEGQEIQVDRALQLRKEARQIKDPDPDFLCVECGEPVIPHRGSPYGQAHIEHRDRNPNCRRSDVGG